MFETDPKARPSMTSPRELLT